jgi:hypothetical protein
MNTVKAGAEEVAACYTDQDGGESSDQFYDEIKELLADHGIEEAVENTIDMAISELKQLAGI